jgi:hypothetical protein
MFRRKLYTDPFERLEQEANDEFRLLDELGPEHFGSEHLLEFRGKVLQEITLQEKRLRLAMLVGGTTAGWFLLSVLSHYFRQQWLFVLGSIGVVVSTAFFFYLVFSPAARKRTRGALLHDLYLIESELRRRARTRGGVVEL